MVKKVLLGLVAVLVLFLGFVATRPSTYRVERSATLAAPPDIVFMFVDDFRRWPQWSPWEKFDPNQQHTYEGPQAGTGASTSWAGNDQVGKGRMTIEESKPAELIRIKLEFFEPWASTNATAFTFKPAEGGGTTVSWSMDGQNDFMGKLFTAFMDMDAMLGKDFDEGLGNLKKAAETEAKRRDEEVRKAEAAQKAAEAAAASAQPAAPTAGSAAP